MCVVTCVRMCACAHVLASVCERVRVCVHVRVVRIEVDLDIATRTPDMILPFLLANSILFLFFN